MKTNPDQLPAPDAQGTNRYIPLLVGLLVVLVALLIPLKIVSRGYLPEDDALRHAAKAVSGKPWPEIVVLGDGYTVDHNFGWHFVLRQVHKLTGCGAEALVDLAVVGCFALLVLCALPWLKRPEAWLCALVIGAVGWLPLAGRAMIGRPLLLTTAAWLTIFYLWQQRSDSKPGWRLTALLSALIGGSIWIHGVWYLWALPVVAFFLARQFSWGIALARAWGIGTLAAALLTGQPFAYLTEAVMMAAQATMLHPTSRLLVSEFQPVSGGLLIFLLPGAMLIARKLLKLELRPLTANPLFWLACMGWLLGFVGRRFWDDWGLWALLALAACDLNALLQSRVAANSFQRLAFAAMAALAAFVVFSSDLDNRWTRTLTRQYLVESNTELAGSLPDRGGILYAPDPAFFYETFFKNPHADWRYLVSFEMTLMPEDDFETLYNILWNDGAAAAYAPWVAKMRPEDRLFVRAAAGSRPPIEGLEWHYTLGGMWSGRLPRTNAAPALR